MRLTKNLYLGKRYYTHFKTANVALNNTMAYDAAFAGSISKMGFQFHVHLLEIS